MTSSTIHTNALSLGALIAHYVLPLLAQVISLVRWPKLVKFFFFFFLLYSTVQYIGVTWEASYLLSGPFSLGHTPHQCAST